MLRIAVIGPESTGKTELCKLLAEHFHCYWEPEIARGYVENLKRDYTFEDVEQIARMQVEQEMRYASEEDDSYVFFDTEMIITKVWFEYKYGRVPDFVKERLASAFFDFYLLCKPDLPWVYDPVREHGDDREFFFNWYEQEIVKLGIPYAVVEGIGDERLQNALKAIKKFEKGRK